MATPQETADQIAARLANQVGQPNRVEGDQGEFEFGSLRDHLALLKYFQNGNVGIFNPMKRRRFMQAATSKLKPPGIT